MFPNFNPNPVPEIPAGQSTLIPPAGRLTTPLGTYLPTGTPQLGGLFNNPASAAAGFLGGTQPTNLPSPSNLLPQIPTLVQQNGPKVVDPSFLSETMDWIKQKFGIRYEYDDAKGKFVPFTENQPTSVFQQGVTTLSSRANYLMNFDPEKDINAISDQTLRALLPGRTFDEIKTLMEAKGYVYTPGSHGHPGVFMLSGEAAGSNTLKTASGAVTGPLDDRNRPEWVDPTTLAAGERVQVSGGTTYVGGTPTATGESQYAVTVAQNLNKKLEEKGAYKWVSKTVKDKQGNWVKVYSKQLRAPYTKRGQKLIDAKGEEQPQAQAPVQQTQDFNQLVTLRVSYG